MDTRKFNSKRYSASFAKELNKFTEIRIEKMLAMLKDCETLMDVGCWDGYIMQKILKTKKAKQVIGVDNSKTAIQLCRKKGLIAREIKSADKKLPFVNEKFDAVFAGEIIEHLYDINQFLHEVHRVLKPQGQLILSTPNLASLGARITLLLGKIPWMIENELGGTNSGHIRYFSFSTLESLLNKHNFTVVERNTDILHLGHHLYTQISVLTQKFYTFGRIILISARKE